MIYINNTSTATNKPSENKLEKYIIWYGEIVDLGLKIWYKVVHTFF